MHLSVDTAHKSPFHPPLQRGKEEGLCVLPSKF